MNICGINEKKSKLEIFPDELFIELFSYIKPVDLYTGFVNLNSRIDAILHDIQININIIDDNQYEQYQQCIKYFANQITYLAIDCHWSCLWNHLSLRPFYNLRSLHLPMPSDKQCQEIRPEYLPHLNHLTINDNGFKSILFRPNKFSNLRICHILRIYSPIITQINSSQLCFTLQALNLYSCSMNNLFQMLQYVPNLKYLQAVLAAIKGNKFDINMKHKNLSHLKVKLQQLDPDLGILLKSMPNLSQLEFIWRKNGLLRNVFNFKKLFYILNQYSTSLQYVDLDLYFSKEYYFAGRVQSFDPEHFRELSDELIWFYYSSNLRALKELSSNMNKDTNKNLFESRYLMQRNKRIDQAKS